MIFSNRFDKIDPTYSLDDTRVKELTLSVDGLKSTISFSVSGEIPEYRYLILDDRIYYVTDYKANRTNTDITAIDFFTQISKQRNVHAGTYTLKQLLDMANRNSDVQLKGSAMPTVTVDEDVTLDQAVEDLVTESPQLITIETIIDYNATKMIYKTKCQVVGLNKHVFDSSDVLLLAGDINTVKDFNPQLDLARRIKFAISSISNPDILKTWKPYLSSGEYERIWKKVDKDAEKEKDEKVIEDSEASDILVKALFFNKAIFKKNKGASYVENVKAPSFDGVYYDLGDTPMRSYNATKTAVINKILSEYQVVKYPKTFTSGEVSVKTICAVDDWDLYKAQSYKLDGMKMIISDIELVLTDRLEIPS